MKGLYECKLPLGWPWPCGHCGNPVERLYPLARYCKDECREAASEIRRRARLAEARHKTCGVCGKVFDGPRRDAKFCGPACKQRAYRGRVTDSQVDKLPAMRTVTASAEVVDAER